MENFNKWLDRNQDVGVLLLRLFIGARLIYGVADNIFSWPHMLEFRNFLASFNFPSPLVCAVVSVYGQFLAGAMLLVGWKTRYAAILMILNFIVALLMVDRHGSVETMTPAMAILFISILLMFQGGGRYSIDNKNDKQRR